MRFTNQEPEFFGEPEFFFISQTPLRFSFSKTKSQANQHILTHQPFSKILKTISHFQTAKKNMRRPGDWNCPSCDDHQFARNTKCRKCGEPKPKNIPSPPSFTPIQREGDWFCCNDLQFARNLWCRKCGALRPAGNGWGGRYQPCHGDWFCCNDLQFARNTNCRHCGGRRPNY